ncbi:hypothetical protein [Arenicella xantha]|uniref:DUF1570 domain-containing protein n=1 Tax=Arenicella xantha TaxID=644221 RepID=A0A395JKL9_9GAMM|nr:hypothetical protein [Arenicella xantha]RBP51251.1 hypothetical protein DFR28_102670 [Arenicella xantha]
MDWINSHFSLHEKLPRPDWDGIYRYVDSNVVSQDHNALWCDIARTWMRELIAHLPAGYAQTETDNFILVSNETIRYNNNFLGFLERCRKRLLSTLRGIASDAGYGKHVVVIFGEIDHYYDYVSFYGPQEGTYGLSSGMYLNYGYGHFVFQHDNLDNAELIAAHEMTHALVDHLPIPAWLNEGMAVNMEAAICGQMPVLLDREMFNKHQRFWGEAEMQEFWRGDSFFRPDEGQALSYQLAQILVTNLSENYSAFVEFANQANRDDGGEAAIDSVFDISLGDMVANFLGEGDWWPQPETWPAMDCA